MSEFDIFFDEYENKHNCSPEKYECFEAGQQSKQGEVYQLQTEIDELQKNFNNALKTIDIQQQFLDDTDEAIKIITSQVGELQKRIDDAVNCLEQNKPSLNMDYKHAINALSILKGEETK